MKRREAKKAAKVWLQARSIGDLFPCVYLWSTTDYHCLFWSNVQKEETCRFTARDPFFEGNFLPFPKEEEAKEGKKMASRWDKDSLWLLIDCCASSGLSKSNEWLLQCARTAWYFLDTRTIFSFRFRLPLFLAIAFEK